MAYKKSKDRRVVRNRRVMIYTFLLILALFYISAHRTLEKERGADRAEVEMMAGGDGTAKALDGAADAGEADPLMEAGTSARPAKAQSEVWSGETGLTAGQPKVLDYLGYHDGASQKEIAAHCYIEAATLTSVLNGMEAKALIERRRLNGNRRTFHIFLTQKGRQQQQRVMEAFQNIEEQTFDGMPEEEVEQFMELYGKIHRRLTDRPMK